MAGPLMTRIIAGIAKGRPLEVPPVGTRPTSDRVRESVFSSLEHVLGGWGGVKVLDLYAGSGAMGLESLSRGATSAVLVDTGNTACAVMRRNCSKLSLPGEVVHSKVHRFLAADADRQFDVVFMDPPYELPGVDVRDALDHLVAREWLAQGAVVVVERSQHDPEVDWPTGFVDVTRRRFGNTSVSRAVWYVSSNSDANADPHVGVVMHQVSDQADGSAV